MKENCRVRRHKKCNAKIASSRPEIRIKNYGASWWPLRILLKTWYTIVTSTISLPSQYDIADATQPSTTATKVESPRLPHKLPKHSQFPRGEKWVILPTKRSNTLSIELFVNTKHYSTASTETIIRQEGFFSPTARIIFSILSYRKLMHLLLRRGEPEVFLPWIISSWFIYFIICFKFGIGQITQRLGRSLMATTTTKTEA